MRIVSAFLCSILLAACSSGGSDGGSNSQNKGGGNYAPERPFGNVTGYAVDALIVNANLSVYSWEGGEKGDLLATATTDEKGFYNLSIQTPDKPILIELVGGYYIEEASGKRIDLSSRHKLRAITYYESGADLSVMVTPWTNVAAALTQYEHQNGTNVNNSITNGVTAISTIVDVDILKVVPADVTKVNNDSFLTDSLKYGITLAAASSLTEWASEQNGVEEHTNYTSINLAEMMYLDVLADGKLNGNGFRITADGSLSNQIVSYSLGNVPVNTELYRRNLALEMLKVAGAEYNQTNMTINDVFSNADRYSTSTHPVWGTEQPEPIDIDGPIIASNLVVGKAFGGNINVPFTIHDLLSIAKVEYYIDDEFLELRENPTTTSLDLDTTQYADGDHHLTANAWDSLGNKGTTTVPIYFDNSGPTLTVTDDLLTNKETFTLSGTVSDNTNTGVEVHVNGEKATLESDGSWSLTIDLPLPRNEVTVTATDKIGNLVEQDIIVYKDLDLPKIEPIYGKANFINSEGEVFIKSLNDSAGLPIYFGIDSLSIGGISAEQSKLTEAAIPFIGIEPSDSGEVFTKTNDLEVEYRFRKSSSFTEAWLPLSGTESNDGGLVFLVPILNEFLPNNWFNVLADELLSIQFRVSDQANNTQGFDYSFKAFVNFPKLHINTLFINSAIKAYEYFEDGSLGGVVGQCSTDDLGYCQIAVIGNPKSIQLRATGGRYTEPSNGNETEIKTVKSYVQYAGEDVVVHMTPLSSVYAAMVENKGGIEEGTLEFESTYGFHPYTTEPENLTPSDSSVSNGNKLDAQLDGLSDFATTKQGTSTQLTTLMAKDYASDGLLDGIGVLQVEPEVLEFGGVQVTANTYRTDINYSSLLASENRDVIFDYLNSQATSEGEIYGDMPPVALDIDGPEAQIDIASLWKGSVTIQYELNDVSKIDRVELFIDDEMYDENNGDNPNAFVIDSTEFDEGDYSATFVVVDSVGNESPYNFAITIDNTAPVLSIDSKDVISKGNDLEFDVALTDLSPIANFTVYLNELPFDQESETSEKSFVIVADELEDGDLVIKLTGSDAAGNSGQLEKTVFVDNSKPVVNLDAPDSVSGGNNLVFKIDVSDLSEIDTYEVRLDDQVVSGDEAGMFTVEAQDLEDGQHTISVLVIDAVGNKTEVSVPVYVDNTVPKVVVDSPEQVANGNDLVFTVKTTDTSNLETYTVTFNDQELVQQENGTYRISAEQLQDGSYAINVVATDEVGNNTTVSIPVYVDNTKPVISLNAPKTVSHGGDLKFTVTVEDSSPIETFMVEVNGGAIEPNEETNDYEILAEDLEDGNYAISVKAQDEVGNSAQASASVYVDNTAPVVTFKAPDSLAIGDDLVFSVQGEDQSEISEVSVKFNDETLSPNLDGSTFRIAEADLEDGDHVIHVKVTDELGNVTEITHNIYVDQTKPEIELSAPEFVSQGGDLAFNVKVEDQSELDELEVRFADQVLSPVNLDGD